MKKIFIYYSLTGNGDQIAQYLNEKKHTIRKVLTKEPLPNNYILQILSGGFKATIKYEDKLIDFDNNIKDYDEIIIGSPIWNDRLSSPINTVLKELDLNNKTLKFILYSGSGKAKKASQTIKTRFPDSKIIILKEPKNNKRELTKLD